jgi:K+-transporting ATPase ATPase A chain
MHSYDYWLILAFSRWCLAGAVPRALLLQGDGRAAHLADADSRPGRAWLLSVAGVDPQEEQSWQKYTLALLAFNLAGFCCCSRSCCSRITCR